MKFRLKLQTIAIIGFLLSAHSYCLAQDPGQRSYRIETRLIEIDAASKVERLLAKPTILVLDRQTASLNFGQTNSVVIEAGDVAEFETSITCHFTPYRLKEGGVKLDMNIEIAESSDNMDDGVLTEKHGLRRLQQIPLGVCLALPLSQNGKTLQRLDVVLTEVLPEKPDVDLDPSRVEREPIPRRLKSSAELKEELDAWEGLWFFDQPRQALPFRTHGGAS